MKTATCLLLSLWGALATDTVAEPAPKPVQHRAEVVAIKTTNQLAPLYRITGPREKTARLRTWIQIEAEIEIQTTHPSEFIPELKVQWFALIKDRHSEAKRGSGDDLVRLTGTSHYRNIRANNRRITVSAYIDPDTMERLTGRPKPRDSMIEGFAVQVSGANIIEEGKYARGLVKATYKEEAKWWKEWQRKTEEGGILPKSKTPFAPL